MRVNMWSAIFNFFAVLLLLFFIMYLHNEVRTNERQFAELHLDKAIDYATEGAFIASLQGGNLGISYEDLQNIRVNPQNTLSVFKSMMALTYDMSLSDENLDALDNYISGAVLALSDGYYIASLQEVSGRSGQGSEYQLKWGMKKPYTIDYGARGLVAFNLSNEKWILARKNPAEGVSPLDSGEFFVDPFELSLIRHGIQPPTRNEIYTAVNNKIMADLNFTLKQRNDIYERIGVDKIYLPTQQTASGVNAIQKPSLLITLSGVDFAGTQKIDTQSVSGFTIAKKRRVLGFEEDGRRYYVYEGQLEDLTLVQTFFNTVDEAAQAGYRPDMERMSSNEYYESDLEGLLDEDEDLDLDDFDGDFDDYDDIENNDDGDGEGT